MGTLANDIKDLNAALDFFAGYAPLEGTVPADYEVSLLETESVKLTEALDFARKLIPGQLLPSDIATIDDDHRAAAVLWFVHTLAKRSGIALAGIYENLRSYPPEILSELFPSGHSITEWVQMGAKSWATRMPTLPSPTSAYKVSMLNSFGVTDSVGIVLIRNLATRLSPEEALNLAAHLVIAAEHQGTLVNFEDFLVAARLERDGETPPNVGHG